jgi:hypothetical protein
MGQHWLRSPSSALVSSHRGVRTARPRLADTLAYSGTAPLLLPSNIRPVGARSKAQAKGLASAPGRIRTCDTRFRRAVLYPLSYEGVPDVS